MKRNLRPLSFFCALFLLNSSKSISQPEELTAFHPPAATELNLKECTYDKDATAIILDHQAITNYDDDYNMITYHYVRMKILKEKGKEYAEIEIPFYRDNDFEFISEIKGRIYNGFDYNDLEKKSIYQKNTSKYWGEIDFTFPEVKVGSVIEYAYKSTKKSYWGLKEWVFQDRNPVERSRYELSIVPNTEFSWMVQKNPGLHIDVKPDNSHGKISFEMTKIPGLSNEPYMDSREDYLQKVSFQLSKYSNTIKYMNDWDQLNNEMAASQEFYLQLKKDLPGTDAFISSAKQTAGDFEKMKMVYDYVRKSLSWNNVHSLYSLDGIKKAWDKKTGNNTDINLILVNLLKASGLDAEPILVGERRHGKVDPKIPFLDQFSTTYAVVNLNNRYYYLDATDKSTDAYLIPESVLNTYGFIVRKKKGELINIADTAAAYKKNITVNATVDAEGITKGEFTIDNYDYARADEKDDYENMASSAFEKELTGNIPGLFLNNVKVKSDSDERKAFSVTGAFSLPVSNSGDYYFLPYNIFTGLTENPFTGDNRFSHINFGYRQHVGFYFHITLDKSFAINELPKSIKLSDPDKTLNFTRVSFEDKENNEIAIRGSFEITKGFYPVSEYDTLKEYYHRLFNFLTEQVVIKKK
ncbi:MAG: DUF3857 domain-containing protein [Sphingobacteriales bacterium]|nr:DUF3857 domain-containing protein [Sphingobacteriales bacterium]MBI3717906.1 DUF3857 domain-containing protein [Sphingobacteriales bacterium]